MKSGSTIQQKTGKEWSLDTCHNMNQSQKNSKLQKTKYHMLLYIQILRDKSL